MGLGIIPKDKELGLILILQMWLKRKPTQVFEKPVAMYQVILLCMNDTYFFDEPYTKKKCHFCNCVGHLSFDCYARYFPKNLFGELRKNVLTNTAGINTTVTNFASPSAGAGPSSK